MASFRRAAASAAASAAPFAIAFAAASPTLVFAHEPPPAPVRALGTVTITGGQPTSLPTQIPTTIEGVTRQEIEQQVNASDSEDALKYLPSLLVRKRYIGDYNHAVLSTRASGTGNSARSMVYADGILLSNYLGNGATFAPRWMLVTPEEIERVDVLYGPFSAAYPGNSVGAVVDFVTRMPRAFEAHAKVGVSMQPFRLYDSEGTYRAHQASASLGNRNEAWSWFLNVNHSVSDGHPLTFVTRTAAQGPPPGTMGAVPGRNRADQPWLLLGAASQYHTVQDHLKARVAYDLTPTVRASYTAAWWRNDAASRAESYLRDASQRPVYTSDFAISDESLVHWMQGLSVKSHGHGVWDWEIAASRYEYQRDLLRAPTTALPDALSGGRGRIVDGQGTGWNTLALRGTWRPWGMAGAHIVDFGLQRDSYSLRTTERATVDWIAGAPAARNTAFQGDTRLTSAYAQDTWVLARDWKAVFGLRAERWEAFNGAVSNAVLTTPHARRAETHLSPKAALAWQATEDWVLKASAGRAVRMPTVSELFQGGIAANGSLVNNDPLLRPEKSWTGELTAEREMEKGQLRLTAFFERTRDALYSQTNVTVTPNLTSIQNVDTIRTRGLEAAWRREDFPLKGLDVATSATWTDSRIVRNDKFPASVGRWQPRIPRWRASAVATWHASDKLAWTLGARYSGRQYSTLDNTDVNGFAYQGASRYFTTDLRALWRIDARWTAAVGIDNLNDYRYWNFHPYPQRSASAELKFDL